MDKNKIKRFKYTPPQKCLFLLKPIMWLLSKPSTWKHKLKLTKTGMEGIKPPYFLLANHQSFYDLKVMQSIIWPQSANYIAAIDALKLHNAFLMKNLGCICKRKFLPVDLPLIKNMKKSVDKLKNILVMYPEARFTLDGTRSYIPASVAKVAKMLGVPLVTLNMHGCYTANPQFNQSMYKNVPFEAELKLVADKEQLKKISNEELTDKIIENLTYNEFAYQKEKGIRITDPERAKGLNRLLYRCPHCNTEYETFGSGAVLRCNHCGKAWEYTELGELRALDGETEFDNVPDWFAWQRECVRKEVESGTYFFEDEVEVHTLPNAKKFYKHGKGILRHDMDGFKLVCNAYGEETIVNWSVIDTYGCHIEYNFNKEKRDVIDLSKIDESYWLYPTKKDVITKISLATEELFKQKQPNLLK